MYHIHKFAPFLVDSILKKNIRWIFVKPKHMIEIGKNTPSIHHMYTKYDFKSRTSVALIPLLGNPGAKHAAEAKVKQNFLMRCPKISNPEIR